MIKEKHKLQKLYNRKPITYGERYRKMRNSLNSVKKPKQIILGQNYEIIRITLAKRRGL